jgi:alkanesulfonate monooxygenase SsuD/methylene tetrahydromethanopterin reductase-like flavin-dependent oxidoreductase (luciferase family)
LGLDVFGVGEHHSADFAVPSPAVVLAAIATRTSSIRLTSAVTVLSVLDPVRVYEDFATLDLLSGGRAELIVGRSAFAEPFALFGIDLDDYDAAFDEKLDLLLRLREQGRIARWQGRFRPCGKPTSSRGRSICRSGSESAVPPAAPSEPAAWACR